MHLPPLFPITDTRLESSLSAQIRTLGALGFPLVQFRAKELAPQAQLTELRIALREAEAQGGWPAVCINDRADLAVLAVAEGLQPWGLHLGQGDLPPGQARQLPGLEQLILGTSTHAPEEWAAPDPACQYAGVGPFRATASKADHAEPVGLDGLRGGCLALRARGLAPVAIGGLTLADGPACFAAGAESLAMVGEIARSQDPRQALWQAQVDRWRARPPLARGQGLVLIGGSGSGKSSLARALASSLNLPLRDCDTQVEVAAGKSIHEIFQESGEAAFRALEVEAVRACLASPAVVPLGAGAWEAPATRERVLESGFALLWLAEVPENAWTRVGGDRARPLALSRELFLNRWARRSALWWQAPMVLPLGRSVRALAEALTPCC